MPSRGSKGEQSRRTRHRKPSRTDDGERGPARDGERGLAPGGEDRLHPRARMALATWPQIDPAVEAIVDQIGDAHRYLMSEMRDSLAYVGLTLEEFKVLMELRGGTCTHGALSRHLEVSTGAMTNRLDKLEREGLVRRDRDPNDRRGVLLTLTDAGSERLDAYIDRGARRERKLLEGLTQTEKRRLNDLLAKLLDLLRAERGS
ncbi:MAG TPA: MarR family winged helix-turn-helix transcriptional regulator [Solirubrobacteraceae bacterium]|nr:MarR family winged helix-turn-helix transcriptional regulator [Solirubrobacteraceae bacterium]